MKTSICLNRLLLILLTGVFSCYALSGQAGKQVLNDTTYMLTYDHGGLVLWGSDHFRERLRNAIEWLDKYKSFRIGLDNEAYVYDYLGENEPGLMKELKGYLEKYRGRFGIGSSTYGQPLSQFVSDESNIRQIEYAFRTERKYFSYRPPVYMMSEHAMHSQIPQILNGFGYDGAIMRTHFMMYGYNPVFNVPIGMWTGVDGSKIPAIPTYPGEGAAFGKTTVDTWILTRYPGKDSPDPMESFRARFSHINPLLASRADDSGLRKEELVKEYDAKPEFKWILLDDLLGIYPEAKEPMVTRPNDFTVRMPWGYCGNEIWNNSRRAEVSVLTAERLAAVELLNGGKSHETDLEQSWKKLLLAQHHDIQICGLLPDSRRLLPASTSLSQKVIEESLSYFAGSLAGDGIGQVTVFNPLSWTRQAWIAVDIDISGGLAKSYTARSGVREFPIRIISPDAASAGKNIMVKGLFRADLEPLSVNSFSVMKSEEVTETGKSSITTDVDGLMVTTPYYRISLAKEGGISSITDAVNGRSLTTGSTGRVAFFEGTIDGRDVTSSGRWTIEKMAEKAPLGRLVEHGFIGSIPYEFSITLYEDNPRMDCSVKFDFNGQMIGLQSSDKRDSHSPFVHEEKLRFKMFPAADTSRTGIRDLPFVIAETKDKYIEGNWWTAVSDGRDGVAFFNKGNMGSISEKDGSFSIPLAYSMYYIWGTRILYGPFTSEFAILPFAGNWKIAGLHRKALEYSFLPQSLQTSPSKTAKAGSTAKIEISCDDDIIMTALYPENGNVVARFFRSADMSTVSRLKLKIGEYKLSETRLDGSPVGDFKDESAFTPWQIKTFRTKSR